MSETNGFGYDNLLDHCSGSWNKQPQCKPPEFHKFLKRGFDIFSSKSKLDKFLLTENFEVKAKIISQILKVMKYEKFKNQNKTNQISNNFFGKKIEKFSEKISKWVSEQFFIGANAFVNSVDG